MQASELVVCKAFLLSVGKSLVVGDLQGSGHGKKLGGLKAAVSFVSGCIEMK